MGNEHIGFRVIHCCVAGADVDLTDEDVVHLAGVALDSDSLINVQPQPGNVLGIHQDDITPLLATVEVFFIVDDAVELTFRTHSHQSQLVA